MDNFRFPKIFPMVLIRTFWSEVNETRPNVMISVIIDINAFEIDMFYKKKLNKSV